VVGDARVRSEADCLHGLGAIGRALGDDEIAARETEAEADRELIAGVRRQREAAADRAAAAFTAGPGDVAAERWRDRRAEIQLEPDARRMRRLPDRRRRIAREAHADDLALSAPERHRALDVEEPFGHDLDAVRAGAQPPIPDAAPDRHAVDGDPRTGRDGLDA